MATPPRELSQTPMKIVASIESLAVLDRVAGPVVRLVGKAVRPTRIKNALSGTWLGHQLHPMLTDVPIGAWVGAATLDLLGGDGQAGAARILTGVGVVAAAPTAAAGLSDWSDTFGGEQRVGMVHALGNVTGLSFQVASYLARRRGRRALGVGLGTTGLGLVAASGYLGGHLAYVRGVGVNHTAFEEPTSDWTDVAGADELVDGQPRRVDAAGTPVVLVRTAAGIFALSATCGHAGGPLDQGAVVEDCVRCPWHGSTFRLADGIPVRGPAASAQPVWETRVAAGRVEVRAPRRSSS